MKLKFTNVLLAIILVLIVFGVSFKIIVVVAIVGIALLLNHSKLENVKLSKRIQIPTIAPKSLTKIQQFVKENTDELNLPPLELLEYRKVKLDSDKSIRAKAKIIVTTLKGFDVDVKFVDFTKNPTLIRLLFSTNNVTSKTKIAKIKSSIQDLGSALGTNTIRFIPIIENMKDTFALELPVEKREKVSLLSVVNTDEFRTLKKELRVGNGYNGLPVALGIDSTGKPVVFDYCKLPHLAIGGSTNSGKSVGISNILLNLLMTHSPETLQLLLVDGKVVELSLFETVPHLAKPIAKSYKETIEFLDYLFSLMQERMETLTSENLKTFSEYNKKHQDKPMPMVLLCIDEFAEILFQQPPEDAKTAVFANKISRLGALCRFTGIFLLLSTQRPDSKILSPLLKANLPARISYAVTSKTNSLIILDEVGAESLLGNGDGLFANNGKLVRFQNCYVSTEEIQKVVEWWNKNYGK